MNFNALNYVTEKPSMSRPTGWDQNKCQCKKAAGLQEVKNDLFVYGCPGPLLNVCFLAVSVSRGLTVIF